MQILKNSPHDAIFQTPAVHFGALLKMYRDRHGLPQTAVVAKLPETISQRRYSGFELGQRTPQPHELSDIYFALHEAGVRFTLQDRRLFIASAKQMYDAKQTHKVHLSEADWDRLRLGLARIDHLPSDDASFRSHAVAARSTILNRVTETRHLIGRDEWLETLFSAMEGPLPVKITVVQGPQGSGKTSELHRIANHFLQRIPRHTVILCEPPPLEYEAIGPDIALELLLGEILDCVGASNVTMSATGLDEREKGVLNALAKADRPVLILLDNAEHLLDERGELTLVWNQFLTKFLQTRLSASLVLATKEWPGWFHETQFVHQTTIPPLAREEGILLLQRLGLQGIPDEELGEVVRVVGGIPQCLEWVAKLTKETLLHDDWAAFDEEADGETVLSSRIRAQRLARLLEDPSLFGGPIAIRLEPLLDRVIKRLSPEASTALRELAVTPIPLASEALKALYRDPKPLNELRNASLLVAYPRRVQLLPMVSAQIRRQLPLDQRRSAEERLVFALNRWLEKGVMNNREKGEVITELACLLLRHHRLLATAELVLYHGWLSFHAGQIQRLARHVQLVLVERPWTNAPETDIEAESGALLLHYYLAPYLGETIDAKKRVEDYERIYAWVTTGHLKVEPLMEVHLVDHIMIDRMNEDRYEEAQRLLESCSTRLESLLSNDAELHATLLSKLASLYSEWSGYAESHGQVEEAKRRRAQTIEVYKESFALLQHAEHEESLPLKQSTIKKKQASVLNNLAYQLNRAGRFEEALQRVNECINLKEQGYADLDSLAASYGEKSQILAALGEFEEALHFDEQAREEIGRSADAGDTRSQADRWIYQVNQARLYLLIGRSEDAERLLQEMLPIKTKRRRIYKVLAEEALKEIKDAREVSPDGRFQLDWRWVRRYRQLSAFDAYWWWAPAGPFTDEERQQWNQAFTPGIDDATKDQLRELLLQSRDLELYAAVAENREPQLSYPALDIVEVRQRIADFLQLDSEIEANEPNIVVRRLYRGAIEDEILFLRLIEATYKGENERFWELTRQLYPEPTHEEMEYALEQVRQVLLQGLKQPEVEAADEFAQGRLDTRQAACQQVIEVLRDRFHIAFDLSEEPNGDFGAAFSPPADIPMLSALGAKRFFEAVLESHRYTRWQVVLDPNVAGPRVEAGLRQVFLPAEPIPLDELREYVSHELAGHVARSIAGESSMLGLLGMGTKGYMVTEEGLADYYERQVTSLHGEPVDDSGIWLGTLAVGLACGIAGPAQTFLSLLAFFEPFLLLYRLLWRDDEDRQTAERRAQRNALTRCLRTFRGVPDLGKAGICNTKDVVYLRGRWLIDQAVVQEENVLDRLAVGKIAYELLPELEKLGIITPSQSLRTLVLDPHLDEYILSFDVQDDGE